MKTLNQPFNTYLDKNRQKLIRDLISFCSIPSVAKSDHDMQIAASFIEDKLIDLGFNVETKSFDNSHPFVFAKYNSDIKNSKTLLIYNHYDVQSTDPLDQWQTPPFKPTVVDDRIYARGINDNKGNLMARIQTIKAWQETKGKLPLNIIWIIEGEEEIGSPNLSKFCKDYSKLWKSADICLWENGSIDSNGAPLLNLGMKGILYVELHSKFNKVDIHSGDAVLVDSPTWRLVQAVSTLYKDGKILIDGFYDNVLKPTKEELKLIDASNHNLVKYCKDLGAEKLLINPKNKTKSLTRMYYEPTLNISGISSGSITPGVVRTVLPKDAFAKVDIRLVPNQSSKEILKKLKKYLIKKGFSDIEVIVKGNSEPGKTKVENKFVKKTLESLKKSYGKEAIVEITSLYGGPLYYVASRYGIPAVQLGCGYPGTNAHAPNENIRLKDYFNCIKATNNLLEDLNN